MKHLITLFVLLTSVVILLTACESDCCSPDDGGVSLNPTGADTQSTYPTAADLAETGTGDNTIATSKPFTINDSKTYTIWPIGDVDYFIVELIQGKKYEFSANRLCTTCDSEIILFDSANNEIARNDNYIGLDSALQYTAVATDQYIVKVNAGSKSSGVLQYTFSAHDYVNLDNDNFSNYYDCDDSDNTIYPNAPEISLDGVDQNCNGVDQINYASSDEFEVDNTPEMAIEMTQIKSSFQEIQFLTDAYKNNQRTLNPMDTDEDYLTVTVEAKTAVEIVLLNPITTISQKLVVKIFDSSLKYLNNHLQSTNIIKNTTNNTHTYYVNISTNQSIPKNRILSTTIITNSRVPLPLGYVIGYQTHGQDIDEDGYYSQGLPHDCDDNDAEIFPTQTELSTDMIDSNCNGDINS